MSHSKKQESVTPYTGKKKKGGNIKIKNLYIKEHYQKNEKITYRMGEMLTNYIRSKTCI